MTTARNSLPDAAQKLLPTGLSGSTSFSDEELDVRFLEASESLLLAILLDPDAPYYLAYLVAAEAREDLRSLISLGSQIIQTLQTSTEPVQTPAIDRHFELAGDYLQRMGASLAVGAAPETDDVTNFIEESRNFASAQLLPHETTLSQEAFRAQLLQNVEAIEGLLPDLRARLQALDPATLFVDDLATDLPKSSQLGILVSRAQATRGEHSVVLTEKDPVTRVRSTPGILAETATITALANAFGNLAYLRTRYRARGEIWHVGTLDGQILGSPTAAAVTGSTIQASLDTGGSPFLMIADSDKTLAFNVDMDRFGNSLAVSVVLPAAQAPAAIVLTSPPGGWPVSTTGTLGLVAVVHVNNVARTYNLTTAAFAVSPLTPAALKSLIDASGVTEADGTRGPAATSLFSTVAAATTLTIGLQAGAWRSEGRDVRISVIVTGSDLTSVSPGPLYASGAAGSALDANTFEDLTAGFLAAGVAPGMILSIQSGSDAGNHRITSVTATQIDVDDTLTNLGGPVGYEILAVSGIYRRQESGSSPTLGDIVSAINSDVVAQNYVVATEVFGRRLRIASKTLGLNFDTRTTSYLEITGQPVLAPGVPVLGLPTSGVFGTCDHVHSQELDFFRLGVVPGMTFDVPRERITAVKSSSVAGIDRPVPADPFPVVADLYSRGALSYRESVAMQSLAYQTGFQALLATTEYLRDVLGQSVLEPKLRRTAVAYIRTTIGDSGDLESGPAEALLGLLGNFSAPESSAVSASLRLLRERGFDQCVDLLLLGDLRNALSPQRSSYERSLKLAANQAGIGSLS